MRVLRHLLAVLAFGYAISWFCGLLDWHIALMGMLVLGGTWIHFSED